jgi:hypothetical protein
MTDHYVPRAMTETELALIRSDNQSSELYLGILNPEVVYSALVNQTFASKDKVIQTTYDNGDGELSDILPGMTMRVKLDTGEIVGLCRIRKTPTDTIFYIGENSDIPWDDNLVLEVLDDFGLWARHLSVIENIPYMDYEIAYSDQHANTYPIPIIGPRLVPAWIKPVSQRKFTSLPSAGVYTGTWGTYMYQKNSNTYGSCAEFSFAGDRVSFSYTNGPNRGIANIYLDNVLVDTNDQYNVSYDPDWHVGYDSGEIANGTHTLKIEVSGTKDPLASDYYVVIEEFEYYAPIADVAIVEFDASLSYCLPDTTVASYLWTVPGAIFSSNLATATPNAIYDSAGTYRVSCTMTAANGESITAYLHVMVFSMPDVMPITQFALKSCSGSASDGGWKFQITVWDQAELSTVQDRAMVVLFARDIYGTTEISIGQIEHRENIIATGWISGESIVQDPNKASVEFTVETAQAWMKKLPGFSIGICNSTKTASAWTDWFDLTVDASLYHLFLWQSTVIPAIDVFLTADSRKSNEQYAPGDTTIYDQLTFLLQNTVLGSAGCDRFGRLFCEVDTQLTPVADRTTFPVILDMQKNDWRDSMPISRTTTNVTSQVNLSGVIINPPDDATPVFSLAPGHVYTPWGKPVQQDKMLLATQALSNELAALKLAWDNHNLEFSPDLAGNNRMLDVFPSHQFVGVVVEETDTPREFVYAGHAIVREINMSEDAGDAGGFLHISWLMEQEVFPGNSTDGDLPGISDAATTDSTTSDFPDPPDSPYISTAPIDAANLQNVIALVFEHGMYFCKNFSDPVGQQKWYSMNGTLADAGSVINVEVTPTGRCFCQVGADSIWTASAPGQPWTKVFDTTMIGNPEGYPYPRGQSITSFGIDRDDPDKIFIIGGVTVTIFGEFIMYGWLGDSSGVERTTPNFFDIGNPNQHGYGTYGDGEWVMSYADEAGNACCRFSAGGLAGTITQLPGSAQGVFRGRYSNQTVIAVDDTPMDISTDNASSFTAYPDAPGGNVGWSRYYQSVSCNGNGGVIIVGTGADGMKKSSDGGTTWVPTSVLSAVQCVWNLGTDVDWLFSMIGLINYTPDAGTTWENRTGDLQSWVGALAEIMALRHY